MNRLITFRKSIFVMLLLTSAIFYGQSKSVETFNASEDMVVEVNSAYTNIIFQTWNKNKVEITAFIDDDSLTETEKQEYFDAWKFNVLGNSKKVVITSNSSSMSNYDYTNNFDDININMDFLGSILESIDIPDMSNMTEIIMESVGKIDFDFEEFKENEQEYIKKFEKEMEQNFGPEFEVKMEAWGEKFGDDMEKWGEEFGKQFEDNYYEDVERQIKEMEMEAEQMGEKYKGKNKTKNKYKGKRQKVKKTIIIKMPKNTKTEVNVRHGELKMANAYNLKATLNYSPFTADNIDGGLTLINAAYAPVIVNNWNQGSMNVNYVEECNINNVKSINLEAVSSNVLIGFIEKSAILSGSIGDLKINKISDNFSNLDIVLENTDAVIKLPNSSYSFYYNGKKTRLEIPTSTNLQLNKTVNGDRILQKGYHLSNTPDKNINIRAMYSSVIIQ
ncbi:MAG: hypothetical protein L3J09_09390 [Flavobacteriaceae bacterium]|nr:hypothetical protein [Flavobacteriaceae bacterium]